MNLENIRIENERGVRIQFDILYNNETETLIYKTHENRPEKKIS